MLSRLLIGNDVVDLLDPHAQGKHSNERFCTRICSSTEHRLVLMDENPHLMLWTLWAIKEASYKAMQKHSTEVHSIPNQFHCKLNDNIWDCSYKNLICEVKVTATADFVHAVAFLLGEVKGLVNKVVSDVQVLPSGINASIAVRQLALDLLSKMGYEGSDIRRPISNGKQLPPQIYVDNNELKNSDISLSHDGRFIAAALSIY